jgi:flavodoxin
MKKALIYYSKTGHTESVAEQFKDVELIKVRATSEDPNQKQVSLIDPPEIENYDHIIFACPVHGFMVCKIMKAYLDQLADLSGKTIDCFVTHMFRYSWLGGTQALKQMKKVIESKNGVVRQMTSINWKSRQREADIKKMIEQS